MGKLKDKFIKSFTNGIMLTSMAALAGSLYLHTSASTSTAAISPYIAHKAVSQFTSSSAPYGLSSSYIYIILGDIIILLFIAFAVGILKKRGQ